MVGEPNVTNVATVMMISYLYQVGDRTQWLDDDSFEPLIPAFRKGLDPYWLIWVEEPHFDTPVEIQLEIHPWWRAS